MPSESGTKIDIVGSVIDSDILANLTTGKRKGTLALFDFKTQVQQFIKFEKEKPYTQRHSRKGSEWTIFTVFFGVWDLLEYSTLEQDDALRAINHSIEELFHNLELLADHIEGPLKVVIPKLMDITFLPHFADKKTSASDAFAQDQHQSVFLWAYWNTVLSDTAVEWERGDLYIPDLNGIIMHEVRAKQLYSTHVSDATGRGKQVPLFDEVERPCLTLKGDNSNLQAADVEKCFNPTRHLFW
jgi:hypothetical protein